MGTAADKDASSASQSGKVQRRLSKGLRWLIVDDVVVHGSMQIAALPLACQACELFGQVERFCKALFGHGQARPQHEYGEQECDDAGRH